MLQLLLIYALAIGGLLWVGFSVRARGGPRIARSPQWPQLASPATAWLPMATVGAAWAFALLARAATGVWPVRGHLEFNATPEEPIRWVEGAPSGGAWHFAAGIGALLLFGSGLVVLGWPFAWLLRRGSASPIPRGQSLVFAAGAALLVGSGFLEPARSALRYFWD